MNKQAKAETGEPDKKSLDEMRKEFNEAQRRVDALPTPTPRWICPGCKADNEKGTTNCPCGNFQIQITKRVLRCEDTMNESAIPNWLCPECGKLMNRKNFSGCSGVVLDWCREHGSWFDRNELQQIVAFIRNGGLHKARELEQLQIKEIHVK